MPSLQTSQSSTAASQGPTLQMQGLAEADEMQSPTRHSSASLEEFELKQLEGSWVRRCAIKILMAPSFDCVLGIIIIANVFIMILETDRAAKEEGSSNSEVSWTGVCGWIVLVIFVLELLLRLLVFQRMFWKEAWNIFDFTVVVVDASFSIAGVLVGDAFPVSILRIFRIGKLARITKLFIVFPELRLLVGGLVGSIRAIFWGFVLLVFFLIVWAIAAVLIIHPLAREIDIDSCGQCSQAYDSVFHAALTFWQQMVAGDAWAEATLPIIHRYPVSILFFLPLFMTIGMAVMNLFLGVVVDVALSTKDQIQEEDQIAHRLWKMEQRTHLLDLCHEMDAHTTGRLNRDDVIAKFNEPGEFQDTITSMDITGEDLNIIWTVIDKDKSGSVPYKELVNGLYSMRESDQAFMLASLKFHITMIRHDLLKSFSRMEGTLESEMHKIESEVEDLERQRIPPDTDSEREDQVYETDRPAVSSWQVLDDSTQKLIDDRGSNEFQLRGTASLDTSKTTREGIRSFPPADNLHEILEHNVALQAITHSATSTKIDVGKGDWDKKFSHDINMWKIGLQEILNDMNQKLESQASLSL